MKLSVVAMKRVLAAASLAWQLLVVGAGIGQQGRTTSALDEAKRLVQGGDPAGALTALERADLHGPNVSDVHAMRGICLALLEKPIESAAEFDEAIRLRPDYAPNYLSAGLAFASFNNLDRALDRLTAALKLDPALPGLRYNIALVLARAGRFAESEKEVDLELRKRSASLDLWQLKARDDYYQKKWEETVASCHHVLALFPDRPEVYGEMGEALFSLNRSAESRAALQKAVALDPDNGTAHTLLGKLFQDAGKQENATREFETAHRLVPSDREVIYRLYRIYLSKGDQTNSARMLKDLQDQIASNKAASDSEARASVLNVTGIALDKKGDLLGALDAFNRAAQVDVTNVVFQRNAALLLCKLSRPDEAIRRLRDILAIDPDDAETLRILAAAKELANNGRTSGKNLPQLQSSH